MKNKTITKEIGYVSLSLKNFDVSSDDNIVKIAGYANLAYDEDGNMLGDRDDEVVIPQSIDLSDFNNNPIMLFNHSRDKPIGKFTKAEITSRGLYVEGEVHKDLNKEVYAAVKAGVLVSMSIGFSAQEGTYTEDYDLFLYTKTSLFEISIVSIPASPGSLFSTVKTPCGTNCLAKQVSDVKKQIKEDEMNHDEVKELLATMKTEILAELKEATPVSEPVEDVETTKEVETVEVIKEVEVAGCPLEGMKSIEITADNLEAVCGALDELKTLVNDFINKELEG